MSKSRIHHAIIMAAGRGTRMMPLTSVIPKPMAPLDGTTLIAKGIENIRQYLDHVHVTVGYKGEVLAEHVIKMKVSSVFDTTDRGNAWWIFNTLMKHLDEPTFVLTSDNLFEIDFDALAADYFDKGAPPLMVVPVKPVKGLDGDYIHDNEGVVTKLDRHDPAPYYCSGIQILNPQKINNLIAPTESFYDVWHPLIAQQQLCVSKVLPQKWVALDTLEQLKNVGEYYK